MEKVEQLQKGDCNGLAVVHLIILTNMLTTLYCEQGNRDMCILAVLPCGFGLKTSVGYSFS